MSEERPLLGPYHIERRLAAGGMAEVFVARREGLHGFQKRVALKRILPQFSSDPDFVWMFIDEAASPRCSSTPTLFRCSTSAPWATTSSW